MKRCVVFVSSVFDHVETGPGVYARYLWDAFRDDADIEFHLVVPSAHERHERIHVAGIGRNSLDTYSRIQRLARNLARKKGNRALVHGNAAHSMYKFTDYAGPWIVQVNDYEAAQVWRDFWKVVSGRGARRLGSLVWRHWQERHVIGAASRVVVNSNFTLERVRECYGERCPEQYVRIYKSVGASGQTSDFKYADPFPNRPHGARIVFIGSDWRRKGLVDLLGSIKLLSKDLPNIHLTVGGPYQGGDVDDIRLIIEDIDLSQNVLLAGRLDRVELSALLQTSDIFVLPSHAEAFGVVVLEAMAAGLPVIASNVGGILEIVEDGQNGLLFPRGNLNQLAESIKRLLRNSALQNQLRGNGLRTAQEFNVKTMISSVRELYGLVFQQFSENQT